jgi:Protein of unknown function (DUF3667)
MRGWQCPTCRVVVTTAFCPRCGEAPIEPRELTLLGLGEKLFSAFTSIDTRTARTVWCLLRRPGALTLAWIDGVRKPYVAPITLFLLVNVLFFAVQSLTGESVFSSSLDSHLHHQDWSEFARTRVSERLAGSGATLAEYAQEFDRTVVTHAKSLIILMTGVFALLLPLVFLRERRPFMVHVVFSLHHYSFLLLLFCVALFAATLSAWFGIGGLQTPAVDTVLSVLLLSACGLYLYLAIGRAYGARGARRIVQTVLLAIAVALIVIGYRFALFLITLSTASPRH